MALTDPDSLKKGQEIYEGANLCHACHRKDLGGLVGPNLTDKLWIHGCTPADLMKNVTTGSRRSACCRTAVAPLSDEQLLQVVSYILSKQGTLRPTRVPLNPDREKTCS